jgi:hypothetical protein
MYESMGIIPMRAKRGAFCHEWIVFGLRYNCRGKEKELIILRRKSARTGSDAWLTRMRVLYREVKLTGNPGKSRDQRMPSRSTDLKFPG